MENVLPDKISHLFGHSEFMSKFLLSIAEYLFQNNIYLLFRLRNSTSTYWS